MAITRVFALGAASALLLIAGGCGGSSKASQSNRKRPSLPGAGKPPVQIGDKNFTEQFLLGELYKQALSAQGYDVTLDRNIGPTDVTIEALQSGRLAMYPEYLFIWDGAVAGFHRAFRSAHDAYRAGQRYALAHGFELLNPTPFSDTQAIAVTTNYAAQNGLDRIGDLVRVASTLTIGGPPQFQHGPLGLPGLERAYDVMPAAFKPLGLGDQYHSLDSSTVQAADVNNTDGELLAGNYTELKDPLHVFGWGNVVPVVSVQTLQVEGPAFGATINRVSALLTTPVMRQLNSAIDLAHEDPQEVARQFLAEHALIPVGHG